MRVGEHDAGEVAPLLHQEADVRHDQIDAGQMLLRANDDAEIDRHPGALAAPRRAHRATRFMPISPTPPSGANTSSAPRPSACPAAARRGRATASCGRPNTSPAVMASSLPSGRRSISRPMRSRASNRPDSSRSRKPHHDRRRRCRRRAAASRRGLPAKPAPRSHCARRCDHGARQCLRTDCRGVDRRAMRARGRWPDRPVRPDDARN